MTEKRFRIRNTAGCRKVLLIAMLIVLTLGGIACLVLYAAQELQSMFSVLRAVLTALALMLLIGWIGVQAKYQIRADRIRFTIFGLPYRTVLLSDFPILLVTNAVFRIHAASLADAMPMLDRMKTKAFGHPVCLPYFVAVTGDFPLKDVRSGMSAGDIVGLNWYHAKPVGLCDADALETIRKNPAIRLCVQTDVLEHYPEMFPKDGGNRAEEGSEVVFDPAGNATAGETST